MRMLCFAAEEAALPAAFVRCPENSEKSSKKKKKVMLEEKQPNLKFVIVK